MGPQRCSPNDFSPVVIALLFGHFLIPFPGLFSRHVKRNPKSCCSGRSGFWCSAGWIMFWLVMPQFDNGIFHFGLIDFGGVCRHRRDLRGVRGAEGVARFGPADCAIRGWPIRWRLRTIDGIHGDERWCNMAYKQEVNVPLLMTIGDRLGRSAARDRHRHAGVVSERGPAGSDARGQRGRGTGGIPGLPDPTFAELKDKQKEALAAKPHWVDEKKKTAVTMPIRQAMDYLESHDGRLP